MMTSKPPVCVLDTVDATLAPCPSYLSEVFTARLDRWWPDLLAGLAAVYPDAEDIAHRVVKLAALAFTERPEDLHSLDLRRSLEPDWFQRPDSLGYAAYADRFAGTLSEVAHKANYLELLGVTYLHLMPLLASRAAPNDGGYAVADYRAVQADLGTLDGLRRLTRELRGRGISLCLDLVLNHVAREHQWAEAARRGDSHYRAYFYTFPDRDLPDVFDATVPEVFPDFAPRNFTFDEALQSWVWTTFHDYQWDVAWSNPDVFCEYADIIFFLANAGVEVLRLDAIAFLWKRLGTNCQNQPEVHAITQALRAAARIACPATIFKAEAIVGPRDLVHYLGTAERTGKVSDLAYHNSLMVHIWSMLASRDVRLATHALKELPPIPSTTAWITYVRCHDDIGWAINDDDATAVGLTGWAHRAFLSDFYSGQFPDSFARGLVFQENKHTGDRRISGTLASLAGAESADELGDDEATDLAVARILLAHAMIFGWGGLPVIWMGDELSLLNDFHWDDEIKHADDNRWVHRPQMPWETATTVSQQVSATGSDSQALPTVKGSQALPTVFDSRVTLAKCVYDGVRHLSATRSALPHLHASIQTQVLEPSDPGVLQTLRAHPLGRLFGVYNVTDTWRPLPEARLAEVGLDASWCVDAISGAPLVSGDGLIWQPPYSAWWITSS